MNKYEKGFPRHVLLQNMYTIYKMYALNIPDININCT